MELNVEALAKLKRLRNDLPTFCRTALKIKLKGGGEGPLILNKAQQYLHKRIEDQLARTGMVRMFILKGRQQGISTYIAARYFQKTILKLGIRAFILSHHAQTTGTLFQIVDKFYEGCPGPLKPEKLSDNERRLEFDNGSQYTVGTAGGKGEIGRGDTNHLFHWSEVAFSENIPQLLAGAVQTVADVEGTEILNESTANGIGNFFYRGCMTALAGDDLSLEDDDENSAGLPYELVFIPWYWNDEYRATVPSSFEPTEHEYELKEMYGLDDAQLQWRRNKIAFFNLTVDGDRKFKQEYPFTVAEAFQASGESLINPDAVARARKSKLTDPTAPLIIGVDPAYTGDRIVFTWRQGRHILKYQVLKGLNEMDLCGKMIQVIQRDNPDKIFVDITGGVGNGAVDRARELGYGKTITGIKFSGKAIDDRYANKRAEMAGLLREWFEDEGGCRIPDDEEFGVEMCVIPEWKDSGSRGLLQLESKDKIKKDYGKSPDIFDSAKLTFAQPVRRKSSEDAVKRKTKSVSTLSANKARDGYKGEDVGHGLRRIGSPRQVQP
jgi:hypothetical protein